jgi:hypothetical protein
LSTSCKTANVDPATPRPNTGYVDFYAPSETELSWDVERINPKTGKSKRLFFDVEPLQGRILRIDVPPGHYTFQITFLNRAIVKPLKIDVEVRDRMITPVKVELKSAGTTQIQSKEVLQLFRPTLRGYAQTGRVKRSEAERFEISAAAQPSVPYRPKEAMPYEK